MPSKPKEPPPLIVAEAGAKAAQVLVATVYFKKVVLALPLNAKILVPSVVRAAPQSIVDPAGVAAITDQILVAMLYFQNTLVEPPWKA